MADDDAPKTLHVEVQVTPNEKTVLELGQEHEHIARQIRAGLLTDVSMGCMVPSQPNANGDVFPSLDQRAADLAGVERTEGESDQDLRQRILQRVLTRPGVGGPPGIGHPDYGTSLAARMMEPIIQRRDYGRLARELLPIQQLPDGAMEVFLNDQELRPGQDTVAAEYPEEGRYQFLEASWVADPPDPNCVVRERLTVLPADDPREPVNFTTHETIGMSVVNPRGVERMGFTARPLTGFSRINRYAVTGPPPLPDWVQSGIWVRHRHQHEAIYQIVAISELDVTLRSRATGLVVPWPRSWIRKDRFFEVEYEKWFDPAPPRSRWDRLLD